MKTSEEALEEWALDEIEFECGNNARTFTREEFKAICASMNGYLDPSSFTMTVDLSSLRMKEEAIHDLKHTINNYIKAMSFMAGNERLTELRTRITSVPFLLQFESASEVRAHLLLWVKEAYGFDETVNQLPMKGWESIVKVFEGAEPLKPRK